MEAKRFKAERISRKATIVLNGAIGEVFPLFGAFEERKWALDWAPELIYPSEEVIEEGTTFKTKGRGSEPDFLWRVSCFEQAKYLIQYLVSTENRFWTITVECTEHEQTQQTHATVEYVYIGLNEQGNKQNKEDLERMYKYNLKDWAGAINDYLGRQNF